MSKTPITPDQIKAGDLIRFEWNEPARDDPMFGSYAEWESTEYRALRDGAPGGFQTEDGTYFLLHRPERPESPVPLEHTPGVLHLKDGTLAAGVWRTHDYSLRDGIGRSILQDEREIPVAKVGSFEPMVMIPAAPTERFVASLIPLVPVSSLQDRAGAGRAVLFALIERAQEQGL